jgi:uncharacterized OsmC-like protein
MAEHVIVRQNSKFETEFLAQDPLDTDSDEILSVVHIQDLTPYTMLLASLGACTAILLNCYAQNHKAELEEVEVELHYKRVFKQDCEDCEEIERYDENIDKNLTIMGNLTDKKRAKSFQIAKRCSVHKMLEAGIKIQSRLK